MLLAFAMLARLRRLANRPPQERRWAPSSQVPWSIQEIRRVAMRLAQRRIEPTFVRAWSAWRRAYQATAGQAHLRTRMQLQCQSITYRKFTNDFPKLINL
jgi:hypothetical protein